MKSPEDFKSREEFVRWCKDAISNPDWVTEAKRKRLVGLLQELADFNEKVAVVTLQLHAEITNHYKED